MFKLFKLLSITIIVSSLFSAEEIRKFKIINNTSFDICIGGFPIKEIRGGNLIQEYLDILYSRCYNQNGEWIHFHGIPGYTSAIQKNTQTIIYLDDEHYTNDDGQTSLIRSQAKWFSVCTESPAFEQSGNAIEEWPGKEVNPSDKINIEDNAVYEITVDSEKYVVKNITLPEAT